MEDILVVSDTPIIDEIHMSSEITSDGMNEIVESIHLPCLTSYSSYLVLNIILCRFNQFIF